MFKLEKVEAHLSIEGGHRGLHQVPVGPRAGAHGAAPRPAWTEGIRQKSELQGGLLLFLIRSYY